MKSNNFKRFETIDTKWKIVKKLGSGAFGTVFEIERKDFPDMKAALKVISIPSSENEINNYREENYDLDEESITSYFKSIVDDVAKEFRLMAQLKGYTNIVGYEDHDVIAKDNAFGWDIFIRMELLTPMNRYFAEYAPTHKDVIQLGIDICKGLEICQKYQIIHRDIKPSNIFVSKTGDFKLGDFGVARTFEKTSSGLSKKGTYIYMAPEVFKGEPYNSNVDIYSLGIVMYKLLNNNLEPFRKDRTYGDSEKALEQRMKGVNIPTPANAKGRLSEIILKACSYDSKERYESPVQMRMELESILYDSNESKVIYPDGDEVDFEVSTIENSAENTVSMFDDMLYNKVVQLNENVEKTVGVFDSNCSAEAPKADINNIDILEREVDIEDVKAILGTPPIIEKYSELSQEWKSDIVNLDTCEILKRYDNIGEWCDEYRAICYSILLTRKDIIEVIRLHDESVLNENKADVFDKVLKGESTIERTDDTDDFVVSFGYPPDNYNDGYRNSQWEIDIAELTNEELLKRYDDISEWQEEYRCLCYREIEKRYRNGIIK